MPQAGSGLPQLGLRLPSSRPAPLLTATTEPRTSPYGSPRVCSINRRALLGCAVAALVGLTGAAFILGLRETPDLAAAGISSGQQKVWRWRSSVKWEAAVEIRSPSGRHPIVDAAEEEAAAEDDAEAQLWSTMKRVNAMPAQQEWYHNKYTIFTNVVVRNGSIEFVHPADKPPVERLTEPHLFHSDEGPRKMISEIGDMHDAALEEEPDLLMGRFGPPQQDSVNYRAVGEKDENPLASCMVRVTKPALVFHMPWGDNIFHFLNDGILGVFATLLARGILPLHLKVLLELAREARPNDEVQPPCVLLNDTSKVMLLAMSRSAYNKKLGYLWNYISTDQQTWEDADGVCFDHLILGSSILADFYHTRFTNNAEKAMAARSEALRDWQQFAARASLTQHLAELPPLSRWWPWRERQLRERQELQERMCGQLPSWSSSSTGGLWHSGTDRPLVVIPTRAPPSRRAVLNEAEVISHIASTWRCDVVTTKFNEGLWPAIELMRRTDVFLGMHGAGMANIMFLPQNVTVVQLFPYGWRLQKPNNETGDVVREDMYRGMAQALGIRYSSWVNPLPQNAFMQRIDFERVGEADKYVEHPDDSLPRPVNWTPKNYWIYQDTLVDMALLKPVIQAAFNAAAAMATRASLTRDRGQQQFVGRVRKWKREWQPVGGATAGADASKLMLLKWVPTDERAEDPPPDKYAHWVPVAPSVAKTPRPAAEAAAAKPAIADISLTQQAGMTQQSATAAAMDVDGPIAAATAAGDVSMRDAAPAEKLPAAAGEAAAVGGGAAELETDPNGRAGAGMTTPTLHLSLPSAPAAPASTAGASTLTSATATTTASAAVSREASQSDSRSFPGFPPRSISMPTPTAITAAGQPPSAFSSVAHPPPAPEAPSAVVTDGDSLPATTADGQPPGEAVETAADKEPSPASAAPANPQQPSMEPAAAVALAGLQADPVQAAAGGPPPQMLQQISVEHAADVSSATGAVARPAAENSVADEAAAAQLPSNAEAAGAAAAVAKEYVGAGVEVPDATGAPLPSQPVADVVTGAAAEADGGSEAAAAVLLPL